MLVTEKTQMTWNSKNKKHYTDLGYIFTKMGDKFSVDVEDLQDGSNVVVKAKCDYCGKEYDVRWYSYVAIKKREKVHTDACGCCCEKKCFDSINAVYGGYSDMHDKTDYSRKRTNLERYGCENVFSSDVVKEKIIRTNLEKYGCMFNQQNEDVRKKTMNTCLEKYGVKNYVELFKGKYIGENSPVWNPDTEYQREERATNEYTTWRRRVFESDHFTCQCCGGRNGNGHYVELHAHHIRNWKDNVESRFDIENGITLCDKCHYGFHSVYGKRNNNREQLDEYINGNTNTVKKDEKIC